MEKILERDFKNDMLELIDKHIRNYSDAIVYSIFNGEPMEISAFVGCCYAMRKLREDVEDKKYNKNDDFDEDRFKEILRELMDDAK